MPNKRWSDRMQALYDRRDRLVSYLIEQVKVCEICGNTKKNELEGHHVRKLSRPSLAYAKNMLIVCSECHSHRRYGTGIELAFEEAMGIIAARNVEKKIDSTIG